VIADDLIYNIQSDYSIILTVDGISYTDNAKFGVTADERLLGGLIFTQSIPDMWGSGVVSTLASIRAASTNLAPLSAEFARQIKGKSYDVEICGVINQGLSSEQVIHFDDRVDLFSGLMNGSPRSKNEFLFSMGSNEQILKKNLLVETLKEDDDFRAGDIDFTADNATRATSSLAIQTQIETNSLTSNNQTLSTTFSPSVTDLELVVTDSRSGQVHTNFTFEDFDPAQVMSVGGDIDVSISVLGSNPMQIVLDFDPADSMKWIFRDIDVETISNWSIEPKSISPDFGDNVNSTVVWDNLDGATQITFDMQAPTGSAPIFVPPADPQARPHIFNGTISVKLWPIEIKEHIPPLSNLAFSVAPTTMLANNVYRWSNVDMSALDITATLSGVSGAQPLIMSVDGNQVSYESDQAGISVRFNRIRKSAESDPDKVALSPIALGGILNNVTPLDMGGIYFDFGGTEPQVVRNNGVEIPIVTSLIEFENNQNANPPIISALVDSFTTPTGIFNLVRISGDFGTITGNVSAFNASGEAENLGQMIERICSIAGLTVGSIDPDIGELSAAYYFDKQVTLKQALDALLAPIDAIWYIENFELIVEARIAFTDQYVRTVSEENGVVEGSLRVGVDLDFYDELIVNYDRVWTPQSSNNQLKSEYQRSLVENHGGNPGANGAIQGEQDTCLTSTESADTVRDRNFDLAMREKLPAEFYFKNQAGRIRLNTPIQIDDPLLSSGMFNPLQVMLNTDEKTQFVRGIWYAQ